MLQLSEFVWTLRSSVQVIFNNFLLINATDRSKISSDQKILVDNLGIGKEIKVQILLNQNKCVKRRIK